ncbi:MAG: endonuclease [Synergistaceae bacterium]|nr:endonuclease [Synergistaceae bacterium]
MKCAADPGKFKTGLALTEDDGSLIFSAVVPVENYAELVRALETGNSVPLEKWCREGRLPEKIEVNEILLGSGTTHKELEKMLKDKIPVRIVDEYGTTLEGRKLYWKLHPPKGLLKLFPTSLRTPPRDIDDLAAWAIILKSLAE